MLETSEIISDEEIIPETAYEQIDYTEYLNTIIENQSNSSKDFKEFVAKLEELHEKDMKAAEEKIEALEAQNETLIEQQSLIYECVGNMFGLAVAFCVGIVLHKVLSVINGA